MLRVTYLGGLDPDPASSYVRHRRLALTEAHSVREILGTVTVFVFSFRTFCST